MAPFHFHSPTHKRYIQHQGLVLQRLTMAFKIEHRQAEWPTGEVWIGKSLEELLEGKSQVVWSFKVEASQEVLGQRWQRIDELWCDHEVMVLTKTEDGIGVRKSIHPELVVLCVPLEPLEDRLAGPQKGV